MKKLLLAFCILIGVTIVHAEESNFVAPDSIVFNAGSTWLSQTFTTAVSYDTNSIGYKCNNGGAALTVNVHIWNATNPGFIYPATARTLTCDDTARTVSLGATYTMPAGDSLSLEYTHTGDDITFRYANNTNPYAGNALSGDGLVGAANDDLYFAIFDIAAAPAAVNAPISSLAYIVLALGVLFIGVRQSRKVV